MQECLRAHIWVSFSAFHVQQWFDPLNQLRRGPGYQQRPLALPPSFSTMLVLSTALTAFIALLFIYLFMPTVWMSFFDDSDAHESGLAAVAARTFHYLFHFLNVDPFPQVIPSERQGHLPIWPSSFCCDKRSVSTYPYPGAPAESFQIQSSSRKRRSSSHTRQTSRSYTKIPVVTKARSPWIRFGRSLAGKQYH